MVKLPCLPAATDNAPTVTKLVPTGLPLASLEDGAVAPSRQVALFALPVVALTSARWIWYDVTLLALGAVKVSRTSSAAEPASKLPVAADRLLGAVLPALRQMLNSLTPAASGL